MSNLPDDNASEPAEAQTLADEAPPARKLWRVGTLTYTLGALCVLFFWLLWGDFAYSLKERSVPPTLQVLLRTYGASALVFALISGSVHHIVAILLGPIISYKSDRHRGRWGRRLPFLMIPTPIAVGSMIGLAFSPPLGRALARSLEGRFSEGACIIACLGFFWMMFEVASITCNAVFSALINDVVPRAVIGRFFGLFRALSLIAGMLFNYKMLGTAQHHYIAIFLGIGALYGVSFTAMCLMVREGEYPPSPADQHDGGRHGPLISLWIGAGRYIRDCFSHPYYLWFFLSFALAYMAFEPINIYSLVFANSLGMSDATYGKWSAVQLGLSLVQAFPLGWLADKLHPIRVTIMSLALYAVTTFMAFLFVRTAPTFAAAHVVCGTISGMWLTATAPLGPALLPRAKFASFISATVIFASLGRLLAAPLIGWVLDRINPGRKIQAYDFHFIYLWTSAFITMSLIVTVVVYRKFILYGGPKHYVAPE